MQKQTTVIRQKIPCSKRTFHHDMIPLPTELSGHVFKLLLKGKSSVRTFPFHGNLYTYNSLRVQPKSKMFLHIHKEDDYRRDMSSEFRVNELMRYALLLYNFTNTTFQTISKLSNIGDNFYHFQQYLC